MTKSNPTLGDLLNKCDEDASMNNEYKEWDQMQPSGIELESYEDKNRKDGEIEDIKLISISEDRKNKPEIEIEMKIDDL